MPNPIVKCTVDSCSHYLSDGQCMAARISVYNDEMQGTATASKDTLCKSFHQGSTMGDMLGGLHNANVGGVIKASFVAGTQITPQVECFVQSCRHWAANQCNAAAIHIDGSQAATDAETDCNTYVPR